MQTDVYLLPNSRRTALHREYNSRVLLSIYRFPETGEMDELNSNLAQSTSKLALAKISSAPAESLFVGLLLTIAIGLTMFVLTVFTAAGINLGPTPT